MTETKTYTREDLIAICERAVVPETKWRDRDSSSAQQGVGKAWALLNAGVDFMVSTSGNLTTDDRTIWLYLYPRGFQSFEYGREEGGPHDEVRVYLPTLARLDQVDGDDWY